MPHVLAELQVCKARSMKARRRRRQYAKQFKSFELISNGSMTPEEYDGFVRDTVNFLEYIGEPVQMKRRTLGIGVIAFLLVFFGFAYALKKEYWKDVH